MSRSQLSGLMASVLMVLMAVMLTSRSSSALPLDDESTNTDSDKRTMLIEKYLELGNRMRGLRSEGESDSEPSLYIPPYLSSYQKRSRSPRTSRSDTKKHF